jgi:hypothetical protein
VFANIGVENSKLAVFRWMTGWDRDGLPWNFSVQLWVYWATNHLFGSGSHSTTFLDAPDNQTSSGEWSRNAKVPETMDTTWFEWNQSKRMSPQSKFASERAPSWWREWIREHNDWWREPVLSSLGIGIHVCAHTRWSDSENITKNRQWKIEGNQFFWRNSIDVP